MIICKCFEIIKSCIIILSVDCNTHLHTLSKKQKNFECYHFPQTKGQVTKWGKNKIVWQTKISGLWKGRDPKIWPGSSTIFYLKQKQKSYGTLKLVNSKFLKNMAAPQGHFFLTEENNNVEANFFS